MKYIPANDSILNSPAIKEYLNSLREALVHSEDRDEVLASVRDHINEAANIKMARGEVDIVSNVLRELGPVEAIARAEDNGSHRRINHGGDVPWEGLLGVLIAIIGASLMFIIPFIAIPLSVGSLVFGINILLKNRAYRGIGWTVVIISSIALLSGALGFLSLVSLGEPVHVDNLPQEGSVPSGSAIPLDK